jgi:hypothetical protein
MDYRLYHRDMYLRLQSTCAAIRYHDVVQAQDAFHVRSGIGERYYYEGDEKDTTGEVNELTTDTQLHQEC